MAKGNHGPRRNPRNRSSAYERILSSSFTPTSALRRLDKFLDDLKLEHAQRAAFSNAFDHSDESGSITSEQSTFYLDKEVKSSYISEVDEETPDSQDLSYPTKED